MNYSLRPYTLIDYEFVYYVKKIVYKNYVEMNWGEWDDNKQRDLFNTFIQSYADGIKIIVADGQMAGFFHGKCLNETEYELGNICLLPEFQNKGIGTRILNEIISHNSDKNIGLRCFKQNPVVNLYKRLGFEVVEELEHHYLMILKHN